MEVRTGKIIYSRNLTGMASSSGCEDRQPPKGEAELFDIAKKQIKSQLRKDVASHYILGICAESRADIDAALDLYKLPDKAIGKPHDDIMLSLNRTINASNNKKKLEEQPK
ncbi:MAG: hypothetical protein KJ814_07000 [Proteobacteria bacterium]|nr:hypothetical protein [Pseudomonadota bacterium]